METIKLSIVIPTKNRAEKLNMALKSIVNQKVNQSVFEVIVIDNGSTDNTKDCVHGYRGQIENLRYIFDDKPGLHVGRNRGIIESKGEIIGFLDDDVMLFPNWIYTVLAAFEDEKVMALCGSVVPYDMSLITPGFVSKYITKKSTFCYAYPISCFWEERISENDTRVHPAQPSMMFGANCVYRKNILQKCQGFHPDGMPRQLLMYRGDGETYVTNFIFKHRMKAMYYAQASVYHLIDVNRVSGTYLKYMFFRNGISNMYTYLRKDGLYGGIVALLNSIKLLATMKSGALNMIGGMWYLFLYYCFYKRVRKWVHKTNYF